MGTEMKLDKAFDTNFIDHEFDFLLPPESIEDEGWFDELRILTDQNKRNESTFNLALIVNT